MKRTIGLAAVATLLVTVGSANLDGASASTDGCPSASTMSTNSRAVEAELVPGTKQAVIKDVRVGHHSSCDRVTIEYTGTLSGYQIGYVPKVVEDASGKTVALEGSAFIGVALHNTSTTQAAPQPDLKPEFPVLRELRGAGDFEGTTSYGLGLRSKQPFTVSSLQSPSRLIIDIHVPASTQVTRVPSGGVATGDGSTSGFPRTTLLIVAACLVAVGGGLFAMRRVLARR
jgi:hypothetical protein